MEGETQFPGTARQGRGVSRALYETEKLK